MAITSIDKLMGRTFFVPSYQRGYRWGRQEVEALLNDLWEFYLQTKEKTDEGERENLLEKNKNLFYCLQPIVLYKDEQARENLLDGQQRLTTIYLLLSYLDTRRREEGYDKPLFTLEYATREDSADFLAKKLFAAEGSKEVSNVDYHYMRAAYGYIKAWFTQALKHPGAAAKLIPLLLGEDGKGPNVRVIEYYVEDDSDPIDVFLRLNQGKIPLTDAELTKALFLQSDKYDAQLLPYVSPKLDLIASEWYAYEQQLSVPKFWHFISPYDAQSTPPSIRLLLELAARDRDLQSATSYKDTTVLWDSKKYTHPCYTIFSDYLQGYSGEERLKKIGEIWERIYTIFGLISEWYEDQELYHYVGYLMCTEPSKRITLLRKLLKQAKTCTAPEFKASLRREIGKKIEAICLNELSYEERPADIHWVLLLHNIHQHIFTSEQIRFPFDLYTKEKWSLEHIYAQQSEPLRNREEQIGFIKEHIATFREDAFGDDEETSSLIVELESIRSQIQELDKKESERSLFENALELITAFEVKHMGDTGSLHGLQNLCLLSRGVNSALSNRTFARKREIMREIVMTATQEYIPMATRRVFLKYYSASPKDNAYWRREDAEAYMEHIRSVWKHYTSPSKAND